MFKNILFDWSGTLCNDLALTLEATNYVLAQYNTPALSVAEFRAEFQLPYPDYYKWKTPGVDLDELETHYRYAFDHAETGVCVIPHAQAFMNFCRAQGIRCFALTSMDPKAFEQQASDLGFSDYFEAIHSGIRNKEQYIHQLLAQHGLRAEETAMIGDMQHDIKAAQGAGVTAIAVLTGYNNAEQLSQVEPDLTVPHLQALQKLLQRQQPASKDRIILKGLLLHCHIGVPDEERSEAQDLLADISIVPAKAFRDMGDDIEKTIDYYALSLRLEELAMEEPTRLLEKLSQKLASCCIEEFGAKEAQVELHKFILPNASYSAVQTSLYRQD